MRLITALLLLVSLASVGSAVAKPVADKPAKAGTGVEFVRVWPAWRKADSFVRIQEYFGRGEDTGSQTMLRTQPDNRTGYYFLTRTRNDGAARAGVRFELEVITPDSPRPKTYTFSTGLPAGGHVFNLGLTGKDWAGEKVQPVAWRLRLLTANGDELATEQSFLWSMPPSGER